MKEKKNKNRLIVFNIFIILFISSYASFKNLTVIRYISIVVMQSICIIDLMKKKVIISRKMMIIIIMLLASMSISLLNSNYFLESIFKILIICDFCVMCFVLLPNYLKDIEMEVLLENIVNDIFFTLMIFYIFFHNDYSISYDSNRIGKLVRLESGFLYANCLGQFAFFGILISSNFLFRKSNIKKNLIFTIFFAFLMIESGCRTAIYSTVIFIFLYIIDIFIKNKKIKLLFYTFVLLIGILLLLCSDLELNYNTINTMLSYRLDYIKSAITLLKNNNSLLLGMGAYRNSMTSSVEAVLLDNGYFNYIYQFGLISFGFLIYFLTNNFKIINKLNIEKSKKIFLKNFYITFLVYSFFDNILFNISSILAITIYTLISLNEIRKSDESKD